MNEAQKVGSVPVAPSGSVTEVPEALAGPPPPEPVYEYRVVCSDGSGSRDADMRIAAIAMVALLNDVVMCGDGRHAHVIERRSVWVGPWEAT